VSDKVDAYALRDAAEWLIKPRTLAVPGVAHVLVFGGRVREIQVAPGIGLSLGALVGLVTVFGISARNTILQLAHYEHMVEREGATWNRTTMFRGANERLTPILMTAAVTALGLAPLAVGLRSPGQELEAPMAITVLGGLVSSTLLNLVLLPVLAHRYSGPVSAAKVL
jgi:Cu/Ag efflux pump CusA